MKRFVMMGACAAIAGGAYADDLGERSHEWARLIRQAEATGQIVEQRLNLMALAENPIAVQNQKMREPGPEIEEATIRMVAHRVCGIADDGSILGLVSSSSEASGLSPEYVFAVVSGGASFAAGYIDDNRRNELCADAAAGNFTPPKKKAVFNLN